MPDHLTQSLHRPMLDLVDPGAQTRGEKIAWEFYHRVNFTGPGPFDFFVGTDTQPPEVTNWPFSTSRFSEGNAFQLYGIGFEFALRSSNLIGTVPVNSISYAAAVAILNNCAFELRIENKEYLQLPLSKLPAGAGLYRKAFDRSDPDLGALPSAVHLELGEPVAHAQYALQPGLYIGSLYQFRARVVSDLNFGAAIAPVRLYFAGVWERNIQ